MRLAIQTLGSRGDVQPYLALALGMKARGHEVQLAAPSQFQELVERHGVRFFPLPGEFLALLDSSEGKEAISSGSGFSGGFKLLKHIRPLMTKLFEEEWHAVRSFSPDMIVYHPKSLASPDMAAALRIPHVLASPVPGLTPTKAFPSPFLPFSSLGPLNRISHEFAIRAAALLFSKELKVWRASALGVLPVGRRQRPSGTIYAFSPAVVKKPPDWGADVLVSGYWFLDETNWKPNPSLARFLEEGPRPIFFGFGSMPDLDPDTIRDVILQALAVTGKRGIIATGGGAIGNGRNSNLAYFLREAPHNCLLPYASAIVHHGGAGTTAAGLRAGLPTLIVPHFGDQPFWARKVSELSVGPAPLKKADLGVAGLATSLKAMDDSGMRMRARTLASAISAEDGIEAAIHFLEKLAMP